MTEKLLQFIWQNRYYNSNNLELVTGESVVIDYPGELNTRQGPDFINARIRIHENLWFGNIELHIYSSGWIKHNHHTDNNYKNVILHVFWEKDQIDIHRNIPQLELFGRIPGMMIDRYVQWMQKSAFIPCEKSALNTFTYHWEKWGSKLLIKRLDRRMNIILKSLEHNKYHWEEQLWYMIAANFGSPVNAAAFESVARSIPFSLIAKHRSQPLQLEALLLGQANMLEGNFHDSYATMLQKEFVFLRKKYSLKKVYEQVHFLRMRPSSFPGIRLSQLANFYSENITCFSWLLQCNSLDALNKKFNVQANDYWHYHYVFEKSSSFLQKLLGTGMRDTIIINSMIPLLYTYGRFMPDSMVLKKAFDWLEEMPAEKNSCIRNWKRIGITVKKGAASQALLELKKQYCDRRKCLDCDIGKYLLNPDIN
jgi:Protein of unknown function (DUF2851)